ncbi:MAG: DUF938 domain-containing protein [Pseudomonadota bacterium]
MAERPETPQLRCTPGLEDSFPDGRLVAASASRNTAPLIEALTPLLRDRRGLVLDVGCGTVQHAAAMAEMFPDLDWLPSDPFEVHLESAAAWVRHAQMPNLLQPMWLDAAEAWPEIEPLTAVISSNVIHISPWAVTEGIVRGAGANLVPGGLLMFYGPFKENGQHTGDGNAAFDAKLRADDPAWGIRDAGDVAELAAVGGFGPPELLPMPANNRLLVFRRA